MPGAWIRDMSDAQYDSLSNDDLVEESICNEGAYREVLVATINGNNALHQTRSFAISELRLGYDRRKWNTMHIDYQTSKIRPCRYQEDVNWQCDIFEYGRENGHVIELKFWRMEWLFRGVYGLDLDADSATQRSMKLTLFRRKLARIRLPTPSELILDGESLPPTIFPNPNDENHELDYRQLFLWLRGTRVSLYAVHQEAMQQVDKYVRAVAQGCFRTTPQNVTSCIVDRRVRTERTTTGREIKPIIVINIGGVRAWVDDTLLPVESKFIYLPTDIFTWKARDPLPSDPRRCC
ncbi:hypothetical protein EDD85DRAFT_842282 [Armillaria nabsnona]|nr:hypothetical protein EDD85DRAFT_842282 [Armillaria nabsnona]